jgi:hypothetical protein
MGGLRPRLCAAQVILARLAARLGAGASCPPCGLRAAAARDQRQFRCAVACAAKECIRRMSRPASRAGQPQGGPVHLPPSARALGDSLVSSPSSASARRLHDPPERNLLEVVAARSRGYRPRVTLRVTSPACWPSSPVAETDGRRLITQGGARSRRSCSSRRSMLPAAAAGSPCSASPAANRRSSCRARSLLDGVDVIGICSSPNAHLAMIALIASGPARPLWRPSSKLGGILVRMPEKPSSVRRSRGSPDGRSERRRRSTWSRVRRIRIQSIVVGGCGRRP